MSGHGMPAALIASMLKIAFSAQSAHATDPALVLSGLNHALRGKFQGRYVTAAYALIDTEKANASLCRRRSPASALEGGIRDDSQSSRKRPVSRLLSSCHVCHSGNSVREGDRILLYTDGIPEMADSSQEQFGEPRLREFLENHPDGSASHLADSLLDHLFRWSGRAAGEAPDDDVTLLAVHFRGSELPG